MNEDPKNIWKKSGKGTPWFRGWLIVVAATFFVVLFVTLLIPGGPRSLSDWLPAVVFLLVVSLVIATVFVGLWAFIRWLNCWRNFKRFLFGLACFVTLIALFYAEEDWRGWHAWNQFKHEWEAKGEKFDPRSVVPPPVPDDQNFALTPIVASSYSFILDRNGHEITPRNTNVVDRLKMEIPPGRTNGIGNWQKSTVSELPSPADDVLRALSNYDATIEELRRAAQLPYSRFPLNYDTENPAMIFLPHLADLKGCALVLRLRAVAELQNGQSEKALTDVQLMLRLAGSIRTEPILISHLVRIAVANLALQPVYDGLAEHKWADAQLAELDRELAGLDFPSDYKLAMRGEMVLCQEGVIDYLRRHPEQLSNLSGGGDSSQSDLTVSISRLIPSGWFYQNQLRGCRFMVQQYLPLADLERRIISPASVRRADAALDLEFKHVGPYNQLEALFLPALGGAVRRFACAQASADMARTAIALERYRLAHGEYPETLDTLAPQFIAKLPHDIINGQPLRYRRTDDGQFVLYSVGWNETDDGGEVGLKKDGAVDINKGDWVWRYPAK